MIESMKYIALEFAVDMYRGAQLNSRDIVAAARTFEKYLEEETNQPTVIEMDTEAVEVEQQIGVEVEQGAEQDSTASDD